MVGNSFPCTIQSVTKGPKHHYFGYYNVTPWDSTGRYMLALEADFCERPHDRDDVGRIGLIDTEEGNSWRHLAETRAWNWQQGCMLQWLPSQADRCIVYNDLVNDQPVSRVLDVFTGETRCLPRPIFCLSHNGKEALSLNFARLHRTRPGYGYVGAADLTVGESRPRNDGIYRMDMESGESSLIVSIRQLAEIHPVWSMRRSVHWATAMEFNPDDTRFVFYHRWKIPRGVLGQAWERVYRKFLRVMQLQRLIKPTRFTRMLTACPDGSDIRILADDGMTSHYYWKNPEELFAWACVRGQGNHYYVFNDRTRQAELFAGDVLTRDGHPSYSPDRKWILTDTYPSLETHNRTLILYRLADGKKIDLGEFFSPPGYLKEIRCDLHPRWNRDGTKVCFDSWHEGSRQLYVADVSRLVGLAE